jgi:hypothetical protein
MSINANSYGTVESVAALTKRFTSSGIYTTSTNPSISTVESWINQLSSTLNVSLAGAGFKIPITQSDAREACSAMIVEAVADLCLAANSSGRFFTDRALERGVSPMRAIRNEMASWVEEQAEGFELLGATRTRSSSAGILYRDADESGDAISPIFQREGFGNHFDSSDEA